LYDETGNPIPLVVTIPTVGTGAHGPTGTVPFGNNFVFVTLDGTIAEWTGGTAAVIKVDNSSKGAVYKGCTLGNINGVTLLYVANAAGGVEVYRMFAPYDFGPGSFTDPNLPAGYTPYGIQSAGGRANLRIYVTYAPAASGPGAGWVDVFDTTGNLMLTLQHGNWMNAPWGIAEAPANFGAFSNRLLVGNEGSGTIMAFNPSTGKFLGFLKDSTGKPIVNQGLWAIYFGAGNTFSGPLNSLYFSAGISGYSHGLFGAITAN
jgi:uncharacterized protein (TIGR03118 family)